MILTTCMRAENNIAQEKQRHNVILLREVLAGVKMCVYKRVCLVCGEMERTK